MDTIASEWAELAMALGFGGHVISYVKKDYSQDCKGASCKILRMWLDHEYENLKEPVSWTTLLQCLGDAGFPGIANEVEDIIERPSTLLSVDL